MKKVLFLCFAALSIISAPMLNAQTNSLADQIDSLRKIVHPLKWRLDSLLAESPERPKISIFAEIVGNGGLGSLNIDYRFHKNWSVRTGLGYLPASAYYLEVDNGSKSFWGSWTVPLMLSYLTDEINNPGHFELGLGSALWFGDNETHSIKKTDYQYTLYDCNGKPSIYTRTQYEYSSTAEKTISFYATGFIGYRYQPIEGGLYFRIGFTPVVSFPPNNTVFFLPLGGLSIGFTF